MTFQYWEMGFNDLQEGLPFSDCQILENIDLKLQIAVLEYIRTPFQVTGTM